MQRLLCALSIGLFDCGKEYWSMFWEIYDSFFSPFHSFTSNGIGDFGIASNGNEDKKINSIIWKWWDEKKWVIFQFVRNINFEIIANQCHWCVNSNFYHIHFFCFSIRTLEFKLNPFFHLQHLFISFDPFFCSLSTASIFSLCFSSRACEILFWWSENAFNNYWFVSNGMNMHVKKINGNATKMQPVNQTMEDANKGNAFRVLSLLFHT